MILKNGQVSYFALMNLNDFQFFELFQRRKGKNIALSGEEKITFTAIKHSLNLPSDGQKPQNFINPFICQILK